MLRTIVKLSSEARAVDTCIRAQKDVFIRRAANRAQSVLLSSSASDSSGGAAEGREERPQVGQNRGTEGQGRRGGGRGLWGAGLALTAVVGGALYYYNTRQNIHNEELKDVSPPKPVVSELPAHAQYVIVGAGTAAFSAARAIRTQHPTASVIIISAEDQLPYMRPPLSKRTTNRRALHFEPPAFYEEPARLGEHGGIAVTNGWRGVRVTPAGEGGSLLLRARDGTEHSLTYDECLLATGCRARVHPALAAVRDANVGTTLRTAADGQRLQRMLESGPTDATVIGHDAHAVEVALALAKSVGAVTLLCDGAHVMSDVLPQYLSQELEDMLQRNGVVVRRGVAVEGGGVTQRGGRRCAALQLSGGEVMHTEMVVEMCGAQVEDDIATESQLEVHETHGGIVVNAEMQVCSHLYAAGDAACFYSPLLGRRRLQSHDHAVQSGRLAGENMAAALLARMPHLKPEHALPAVPRRYVRPPMLWAEMGPTLMEGVGVLDANLRTLGVWAPPDATDATDEGNTSAEDRRGVMFYLSEERVVGVLMWNLLDRLPRARQVLEKGRFDDLAELAKLFHINED